MAKMRSVPFHHVGSLRVTRIDVEKGTGMFKCQPPNLEFFPKNSLSHGADGSALPTKAAWERMDARQDPK
eukprot:CAMPEP_0175992670 /NCGR_PEP_ID=MMETSP0108-20121206/53549_1 /TAXON_ID=195067 ORGANISM="Goniomonas pacifica, Strain CCMP1869" /NCGR_SAMPLE_ID=MMETSP0108 /ASSEMBLY_ACC=CAM_ASM_000204 /LENGTH=69 /DNA_ID=CAMNT_0017324395 /DNA_START=513 /DNA_END=722 /DNA_ORIENTATION=-